MTLIIIIITAIFSISAFQKPELMYKYQFNPYQIIHRKEWVRMVSHALLHADWTHLIINMFVLYSFGTNLEFYFKAMFGTNSIRYFLTLYIGGIIISTLYSLKKNKDNYHYNAVGASGAVSAIVFCNIFFLPLKMVYFFGIIPIPGIIFGVLYLIYSYKMGKKGGDHIAHDAHFWGAVFGFIFPLTIEPKLIFIFISQLLNF